MLTCYNTLSHAYIFSENSMSPHSTSSLTTSPSTSTDISTTDRNQSLGDNPVSNVFTPLADQKITKLSSVTTSMLMSTTTTVDSHTVSSKILPPALAL